MRTDRDIGSASAITVRRIALIVVGVSAISSSAILVRWASAPALALSFWRCFGGAAVLVPLARTETNTSAGSRVAIGTSERRRLFLSGVLLAIHFALFIGSLGLTTVASSVTLATMSPIFVAAGSVMFLGERASRQVWLGLVVTVIGAVVIGTGDVGADDLGRDALIGDVMAVGAAATMAAYMVIGRSLRGDGMSNATYSGWTYAGAALSLVIASAVSRSALVGFDGRTWLVIVGLIIGPQLLGHTVLNHLLSTMSATVVSLLVLLEPVVATVLAGFIFAEQPTSLFWIGAPLVLVGVTIALGESKA